MTLFKLISLICCLVCLLSNECLAKGHAKAVKKTKSTKSQTKSSSHYIPDYYEDGKRCDRVCNGQTKSCYFNFNVETFYTMSKACYSCPNATADCFRPDCIIGGGVQRTVMVVNRQMPGPAIVVCEGDEVMVHVVNTLADGEGTTIHWHGQHMVRDKYMDGVPFVTQCPIHHNNNFTYEYWADDAGTYFWHSHVEMQRGDGVYGALIVRQPSYDNNHRDQYDFDLSDHVIMAGDWNDRLRLDVFEAYALAGAWLEPTGILVNGLGYQFNNNITNTPLANFVVQRGSRYRFRFINVNFFDCPLEVSIDNHKMRIIASDSQDVQPFEVDSFVSNSGERFDFVINANQAASTYWIRVKGYLTCERLQTHTVATLQYQGSQLTVPSSATPTYSTAAPSGGVLLNPISERNATGYRQVIAIDQMKSVYGVPYGFNTRSPYRYYISVDMSGIDHPIFHRYPFYGFNDVDPNLRARTPQFNRISHKNMDVPLMPARFSINNNEFCNANTLRNRDCKNDFCECTHVIQVPKDAIVELVFMELFDQDDAPALHPIHLHGYSFRVIGWAEIGRNFTMQQVIDLDTRTGLERNYNNPPLKDTVSVPKGGYTIVRFVADNPGYWFMHCHIDVHASEGMEMVIKVGENYEMPNAPDDFPVCGNYHPY